MTARATPVSRRFLLLGAAGLVGGSALLASCGGTDDGGDEPSTDTATNGTGSAAASGASNGSSSTGEFVVVQRFPNTQAFVAGPVRLPVSLARTDASLLTEGPDRLTGEVLDGAGAVIGPIDAVRRGTGLSVPYWSIATTLPKAGIYDMRFDGAIGDPTPVLVNEPGEITMPYRGSPLPGFDTPTTADARGVDPVCTRLDGPCPFHEMTLNEALALRKPVAYLVGTPAHCATATCGPGLDFLMAAAPDYQDRVTFVHAEVFADPGGTVVAPAVEALTLAYEPVIFLTDESGTVLNRIDIVWDADDLAQMLAATFG